MQALTPRIFDNKKTIILVVCFATGDYHVLPGIAETCAQRCDDVLFLNSMGSILRILRDWDRLVKMLILKKIEIMFLIHGCKSV